MLEKTPLPTCSSAPSPHPPRPPPPALPQAALRAKDIVPRQGTVYRAADVAAAIEERYGARPLVHCYGEALSEVGEGMGRVWA